MGLLDFWTETIGVDPGTHNLRLLKGDKLIFNERSQISVDTVNNKISGFGEKLRNAASDVTIKPVHYAICDFHAFEMLLRAATKKALNLSSFLPKSLISFWCIPTNTTEVEKRAYRDSGEHANSKEVYMIHQSCCTAIGLNILLEKKNFVIIDFSSSKIETTIFSDGRPISVGVFRMGTWQIFRFIRNHILRKYRINLSDKEIMELLADMNDLKLEGQLKVQYTTITTSEITELLANYFNLVNDDILETFERVSGDNNINKVFANGVYFTGGGSAIEYLRRQIKLDDRIKISVSQTPLLDNINGLKIVMKDKEKYRNYIMT
jgi:rod shape-determining protein MreB and related proteins